jgi:hypothetical protein
MTGMMAFHHTLSLRLAVLCLCLLPLWSIASPTEQLAEQVDEADTAALLERAERYWRARELNDIHTVFELEVAASTRGGWLTPMLMARMGMSIRDVELQLLEIADERATFEVKGMVEVGAMGFVPQTAQDRWIRVDGQWLHETAEP